MTDTQLIDALAADLRPSDPSAIPRRLAMGLAAGAAAAAVLVLFWLGIQPGLAGVGAPAFLMKLAYLAPLAALAFLAVLQLGRPGAGAPAVLPFTVPVAILAMAAVAVLAAHPVSQASGLIMGGSWRQCPLRIAVLSVPVFMALMLVVRPQAPTRLRFAGAMVGLLSGASAAAVYALACTEGSPAFVLIWYSAGIAFSTALGALLGPRLLRW